MTSTTRRRCWKTHRRREDWHVCPLCGAQIKWVRLWSGDFSPCDVEPVLFLPSKGARYSVVTRRELIDDCRLYNPRRDGANRPNIGSMPHYYTCPVLIEERRAWAKSHRE